MRKKTKFELSMEVFVDSLSCPQLKQLKAAITTVEKIREIRREVFEKLTEVEIEDFRREVENEEK